MRATLDGPAEFRQMLKSGEKVLLLSQLVVDLAERSGLLPSRKMEFFFEFGGVFLFPRAADPPLSKISPYYEPFIFPSILSAAARQPCSSRQRE